VAAEAPLGVLLVVAMLACSRVRSCLADE